MLLQEEQPPECDGRRKSVAEMQKAGIERI
jgi:hypothetical protein